MVSLKLPKQQHAQWIQLLPLVIPFGLLFGGGILVTLRQALLTSEPGVQGITLDHFREVLSSRGLIRSLGFSLRVGFISATGSTLGGVLAALLVHSTQTMQKTNHKIWAGGFERLLYIPIVVPPLAAAYLVVFWFGSRGMVGRWFHLLGITYTSPLFQGNGLGIILAYWYKQIPFAMLMILPVLRAIPQEIILTGRMMGASPTRIFFQLILPRLVPAISSVFLLLLIYNIGSYDIPFILGESRMAMVSQVLYRMYFVQPISQQPVAAAGLMVLFALSLGFMILLGISVHHIEDRERRL
jgi:putative spermidine/putrescine transport system permease protein